ncbi:MAG: Gfo/Idh/MocA family oxidoreductase [Chloroflexi bacterium]|nr:Gfo/Idh/MocA family oxidoreductase [Chloroflexota bacterium]
MASKLRFGVISTARIGVAQFIPAVRESERCEVIAIASRDLNKAQRAASELQIPKAYGSYGDLLNDPEIDAVYISLPNSLHAEWSVRAAAAKKHVLCEKPVARTTGVAREMVAAAEGNGVLLMEAFMYRHHPQHATVKELVAQGKIGVPRFVRASFCFTLRNPDVNIRTNALLEGGALMDVGCYSVNAARYLFDAEPAEVSAFQHRSEQFGVDISFGAVMRFPGDRLAMVDCSFETASGGHYEVAGSEGSIIVDRAFTPGTSPVSVRLIRSGSAETIDIGAVNQYALEADHLAKSIAAGRLLAPAEDGVANTRVIEALYAAAARSAPLSLL